METQSFELTEEEVVMIRAAIIEGRKHELMKLMLEKGETEFSGHQAKAHECLDGVMEKLTWGAKPSDK